MKICECCGNKIGMLAGFIFIWDLNQNMHYVCKDCLRKAGGNRDTLHYDSKLGKVVIGGKQGEIRKKCKVCGNVFCYTAADMLNNSFNKMKAQTASLGTTASLFTLDPTATATNEANERLARDKVIDLTNVRNVVLLI